MRTQKCLLLKVSFFAVFALALQSRLLQSVQAQDAGGEVVPASYQSGGFFNQQLGTALRFNYHTQGYGTQDDVFSIGGMKIFNLDDATAFIDGQGTLSDDFGGGFNLGVGYRQLTNTSISIDPQRILGAGFWTDGQSSSADNFFTQLGFSLESLGESFDLRLNGHFPLQRTKTGDPVLTSLDTTFSGNNLFSGTETIFTDTAHSVVDGEFAKRINDLEAWAYIGGYQIGGGGQDATGYRVGVRGYAVPDLALSLQVTDDDIYATNVMFGITWFVGRTNKCNGPCGTILDRMREPVLRNDFIAMTQSSSTRAAGSALTLDGTNLVDIVHVDSTAGAGGDGTFENPFNELVDIDSVANAANTRDGSIVLVHGDSALSGSAQLRENVRLLGEGIDQNGNTVAHFVQTSQNGANVNVALPETAAGAQALNRATIDGTGEAIVLTMANGSAVDNFTINGGQTAISANGVAVPTGSTVANVEINDPTVAGISLTEVMGTASIDSNVIINRASGTGLLVDGGNESVTMFGAINDSTGNSVVVRNRTGGTVTYAGSIDDDLTNPGANNSLGVLIGDDANPAMGNADAIVDFNNASVLDIHAADGETGFNVLNNTNTDVNVTGVADLSAIGAGRALAIAGNDATSDITFADLNATALNGNTIDIAGPGNVTISSADTTRQIANTGTGNAFVSDGTGGNGTVIVNSNINEMGGGTAVRVENRAEANDIQFLGEVSATGSAGVFANNNSMGTLLFTQSMTLNTGTNNAVELTGNTGATLSFNGFDIDTTDGSGFVATGGGTLLVSSPNNTNSIDVTGAGVGVNLTDMTIDTGNVTFDTVNVGNGAGMGINLQNLDGTGTVNIGSGTNIADGGTLTTADTAINVSNADNVTLSNLQVTNGGLARGLVVANQATGSIANFNNLDINTANADAVNISGNADGAVTFTTLAATTSGTGDGIDINEADASTVAVTINDATVNANGTGRGFAATGGGTTVMGGTNAVNSSGATAFEVTNVENLTASDVTIANTNQQGVVVTGQNTATDSVTLTNFDVTTTTADGVTIANNSNGTVNLNSLTANTGGNNFADAVVVQNNPGATININGMTATATGLGGDAFLATGGGTLSATGTNTADTESGLGVNIEGITIAAGGVTFASVDKAGGSGNGVRLNNLTGGQVAVNGGAITSVGTAVSVTNADNFVLNNVDIDNSATTGAGIAVTNAAGDTFAMSNVDVQTSSASGVSVNGGTFTATGTNTVATTTGTGLNLSNATIGGGGANFNSVNVNGATNGVVLNNLSGGQVTVGNAGSVSTINTTGDAIVVTNTANVDINNVDVDAGGSRGLVAVNDNGNAYDLSVDDLSVTNASTAIDADHTGAGDYTVAVTNSNFVDAVDVNADGSGEVNFTFNGTLVDLSAENTTAFTFNLGNAVSTASIQIDNSDFRSADAVAFDLDSNTVAVKNVTFQLTNTDVTNNSASAAAEIDAFGPTIMNATVTDNVFTNTTSDNIDIAANNATSVLNLDFKRNTTSGGTDSVVLRELNVADFNIVDAVDLVTDNPGVGNFTFDSAGNVIGDFDDIPALP